MNREDSIHRLRRELAHRDSDGIHVWLLWSASSDAIFVVVHDRRADELFELEVEASHALDAFDHPYAYAARGGVERRAALSGTSPCSAACTVGALPYGGQR